MRVCSRHPDHPVFHEVDLVHPCHGSQSVGDHQNGLIFGKGKEQVKNLFFRHFVQTFRRLIQKEHGRITQQDPGNPENDVLVKESYHRVLTALKQLDSPERETLVLAACSSMTYREIGEILEISEANVKVKVHRARVKLRKLLGQEVP